MTTPSSSPNEPRKFKRILNASEDDSVISRLPRGNMIMPPATSTAVTSAPPAETVVKPRTYKFLEAFWTIASVISFMVSIAVIAILLFTIQVNITNQANGFLAVLYSKIVKIVSASVSANFLVLAFVIGFLVCSIPSGFRLFSYYQQLLAMSRLVQTGEREFESDLLSYSHDLTLTLAGQELLELIGYTDEDFADHGFWDNPEYRNQKIREARARERAHNRTRSEEADIDNEF